MIPTNLRAQFHRAIVPVVTVLAVLLIASLTVVALTTVSTADIAADQSATDRPTVDVAAATLADGETTTVPLTLSTAPEGLSGYNLELSVADADVARIESATYPDRFGLTTEPELSGDGRTVTLEAADLSGEIEPGAENVTLATVTVAGVAPGAADLEVEPVQFDGDDGSAIEPAAESGVVTVGSTGTTTPASTATDAENGSDAGDPAPPADGGTDAPGATTTSADGSLHTALTFGAAGLALLGGVALRRRLS